MRKLILIKLGGSVITDKAKPFTARPLVIKRLALEIKKAKNLLKNTSLIIGHGSGSFGHTLASKYQTQMGLINKNSTKGLCQVSNIAVEINRIVLKEFLGVGINVFSFSPVSYIYSSSDKLEDVFLEPIKKALELGLIPLVYGDVIFDAKKGFCIYSGEKTLDVLAVKLSKYYKIDKIIMVGDTDGVYDAAGKTIRKISPRNFPQVKKILGGSKSIDVTGGMLHKVEESLKLARKYRISTLIVNGGKKGNLFKSILLGKEVKSTEVAI
ncbi:hypothetical protein COT08_00220 [Candidatus Woesebacteria bacterium CG07_land_8_20_14_0_80_44_9]|uniref:Isopentenyl phosphate kinase n=2 Tax=Candidatus Woeseibacteriota TaxID=1752722 RepID=A0A2M6YF90_9BACT|nr:MAG: hypothetical protein COT08_00220 [Candidatus Woesebacteria bacterium CG07_land_8_20_14_0_80_44_9]PIZ46009.1 MAG: hypothetical protein COY30_00875 [Candidatus Woesebacteria bacterium CG_4_10_14_0_2_um_filter_44_9]